jgi:heme/copper-type cytochrome/quinol oxidase subunit 3
MMDATVKPMERTLERTDGLTGVVSDWASDQRAFKSASWGKAMMWIFLLSDTFIFGSFLLSYMTVRMSTTVPWPNPSEVFALHIAGANVPLILIASNPADSFFYLITALHGLHVLGGLVVLAWAARRAWKQFAPDRLRLNVELTAIYWHAMLVIWLVLFSLVTGLADDFGRLCGQFLT